jgi:hypothetical protein
MKKLILILLVLMPLSVFADDVYLYKATDINDAWYTENPSIEVVLAYGAAKLSETPYETMNYLNKMKILKIADKNLNLTTDFVDKAIIPETFPMPWSQIACSGFYDESWDPIGWIYLYVNINTTEAMILIHVIN